MTSPDQPIDLLIVGGGINGCGIARDAAGRGLSVTLVEQDDLASHTSSASTKLIHGGLRYLEYREFRLVREALAERERLLAIAPHIIWPLRFVLPHGGDMRPAWLLRLGLLIYDNLGGRRQLPASKALRFDGTGLGAGLKPAIKRGFAYSDCWVEDSRLVALNAVDAAEHGASIRTRTRFLGAQRTGSVWEADIIDSSSGARETIRARRLVNAAGPWVGDVIAGTRRNTPAKVRLVKGSHIVVPRLYEGDHAYLLQNDDRRVVFTIPYEQEFTLIGTTDVAWTGDASGVAIDPEETRYLCACVTSWLARPVTPADVVWSFAGVRSLYDDGAEDASAVTRDYVLERDGEGDVAPLLSIFGGKITTYRRLAEHALEKLGIGGTSWTAAAPLPGGDMQGGFEPWLTQFQARHAWLPAKLARRLACAYGTRAERVLGGATCLRDLGEDLGGGLTEAELAYLVAHEFARSPQDVLWRRSKLGLHAPRAAADLLARRREMA